MLPSLVESRSAEFVLVRSRGWGHVLPFSFFFYFFKRRRKSSFAKFHAFLFLSLSCFFNFSLPSFSTDATVVAVDGMDRDRDEEQELHYTCMEDGTVWNPPHRRPGLSTVEPQAVAHHAHHTVMATGLGDRVASHPRQACKRSIA
jgi:hypothetical protein